MTSAFPDRWEGDHRIQALLQVVRSPSYRRALGELPGYDSAQTGELAARPLNRQEKKNDRTFVFFSCNRSDEWSNP